jgi:arabinofuranan 3-O-arabinosyltransferase
VVFAALCVPLAAATLLHIMNAPWRSPAGAATLLGLAVSESVTVTLGLGNVNTVLLMLEAFFLWFFHQRRDDYAGLLLGLAVALKPVLGPVLIVPLLARRWRVALVAGGITIGLNTVGFLLAAERTQFIIVTIAQLTSARPGANSSVPATLAFLHLPNGVAVAVRVVVLALVVLTLERSRRIDDDPLRVAIQLAVLLLGTFLTTWLTEMYWSILVLPLIITVLRRRSPMHTWWAWLGVFLFSTVDVWAAPAWPRGLTDFYKQLHPTIGWALLLVVTTVWTFQSTTAKSTHRRGRPKRDYGGSAPSRSDRSTVDPTPK